MSDRVLPKEFPLTPADKAASDKLYQRMLDEMQRTNFLPDQNKVPIPKRHPASQAFHDLCDAMKAMHDRKQADYGRANDPFANVRASEDFGMPGWVGTMVRANDKMRRIQKAAQGGKLSNEGVEDSLMDLAVYSIIALVLYREEAEKEKKAKYPLITVPAGTLGDQLQRWDQPDGISRYVARGRWIEQADGSRLWVTTPEVGQ